MSEIDEHLERQINRALDGELTEDERLALDRELIRQPQARREMERSAQLDALAGETLRALLSDQPGSGGLMARIPRPADRPGYHRGWWLLPGAVAAAILALVWVYGPGEQNGPSRPGTGGLVEVPAPQPPTIGPQRAAPWVGAGPANGGMVPVTHRPTRTDRAVDRGIYGVRGSDGNIYLIEVRRTRTTEHPGGRSRARPVGGDL